MLGKPRTSNYQKGQGSYFMSFLWSHKGKQMPGKAVHVLNSFLDYNRTSTSFYLVSFSCYKRKGYISMCLVESGKYLESYLGLINTYYWLTSTFSWKCFLKCAEWNTSITNDFKQSHGLDYNNIKSVYLNCNLTGSGDRNLRKRDLIKLETWLPASGSLVFQPHMITQCTHHLLGEWSIFKGKEEFSGLVYSSFSWIF